jgi:diphthamide synthase (EF-2-diphthine--ammonia ligase)
MFLSRSSVAEVQTQNKTSYEFHTIRIHIFESQAEVFVVRVVERSYQLVDLRAELLRSPTMDFDDVSFCSRLELLDDA